MCDLGSKYYWEQISLGSNYRIAVECTLALCLADEEVSEDEEDG